MRRVGAVVVGAVLAVAVTGVVRADAVLEQIDAARDLYQRGELSEAISELEFAIQSIRGLTSGLYAATFPPPPAGWTADEVDTAAAFPGLGGQMVSRTYRGPGDASIEAQLMIDNPMLSAFAAMAQNPAMLAMEPNMERVRMHRSNAMVRWPGDGTGELTLVLAGRALIRLEGENLTDRDVLVGLAEAWDVEKLREVGGF